MLKISCTASEDRILLRLEGDVRGEWVDELRRACDTPAANGHAAPRLVVDLRDVLFIDARGVLFFRELHARSAEFVHCSAFVAEQLKEVTNGCR